MSQQSDAQTLASLIADAEQQKSTNGMIDPDTLTRITSFINNQDPQLKQAAQNYVNDYATNPSQKPTQNAEAQRSAQPTWQTIRDQMMGGNAQPALPGGPLAPFHPDQGSGAAGGVATGGQPTTASPDPTGTGGAGTSTPTPTGGGVSAANPFTQAGNSYAFGGADSWITKAGIVPTAWNSMGLTQNPDAITQLFGEQEGLSPTAQGMVTPFMASLPILMALDASANPANQGAGGTVFPPQEGDIANQMPDFYKSLTTPGGKFDAHHYLDELVSGNAIPSIGGAGYDPNNPNSLSTASNQVQAFANGLQALSPFLGADTSQYLLQLTQDASTQWQKELAKGNMVSFVDYLRSIGAGSWM